MSYASDQRREAVAKTNPRTKKQALRSGRTLAGRVLRSSRTPKKDKRLAAGILSHAGRKKARKKSKKKK
jgi:hypothetical protein